MDNLPPVKNCMVKHAARFGVVKATVIRDDGIYGHRDMEPYSEVQRLEV